MLYKIDIHPSALKYLRKIPKENRKKIRQTIKNLSQNPRPNGIVKLAGKENYYRIRVNKYRIIYSITDKQLNILIVKISHRKNAY
ncbi:MAG: type II toxin-antitoxin system RelE/ParE family toxin [Candidatus Omnitrophota bacterium]